MLKDTIPDIASKIELPDLNDVLEFFSTRYSSSESSSDKKISNEMKSLATKLLDMRIHFKE